jgi:type II secretory ATPase GspE/PulE/Tfp pilus assembly ATPase PilB-like protein
MKEKLIGEILLEHKLLTPAQLGTALARQKEAPVYENLGRILVRLGYIKEEVLQAALDKYDKRQKFMEVLLNYKFITAEELELACEMSKIEHLSLARVLLNLDFLNFESLAKALSIHYDRPFIHLSGRVPELKTGLVKSIISFVDESRKMVPVRLDGNIITIAMTRPLEPRDLQRLEEMLRLKVETVIAPEDEIISAQKLCTSLASPTGGMVQVDIPDSILDLMSSDTSEPEVELEARGVTEKDSLLVKVVNKIIYDAWLRRASDIHIEPGEGKRDIVVRMRIDGCCEEYQNLPYKYKYAIPSRIKIMAGLDIAERRKPQDGKIDFKKYGPADIELRVATMPTVGALEDVVIRLLNNADPVEFKNLGLTERNLRLFTEAIHKPYGLILVVGPTGSGKTTTLHSAVATINTPKVKIWTVEDPVEITQNGLRQVQVNQKIGLTFATTLRSFLRLDPDIIMVGEMRDAETAAIAVEASLTGHLVFSTLHTNSAPETLTRLLDMGIDRLGFADSLLCILAQRLARRLCDHCKEKYVPDENEWHELVEEYGTEQFAATGLTREGVKLARKRGCDSCNDSGYRGRLGVHELLHSSELIKQSIKGRASTDLIREQSISEGMTTLQQDGILKVMQGLTDIHEIRRVCTK